MCRRQKTEKRLFNIILFIYSFATYAQVTIPHFPTPTRASLRGQMQIALATVAMSFSLASFQRTESLTTNSSSRYFDTAIWSPSPFLRRVFSTRSRASACPDAGSSGRSLILVSVGSPWACPPCRKPDRLSLRSYHTTYRALLTNDRISVSKRLVLASQCAGLSQIHLHQ